MGVTLRRRVPMGDDSGRTPSVEDAEVDVVVS